MRKLIALLVMAIFSLYGCQNPESKIQTTELGIYTPYALFPETLKGPVMKLTEKNFIAIKKDGKWIESERLDSMARDTIGWTDDFIVQFDPEGKIIQSDLIKANDDVFSTMVNKYTKGKVVSTQTQNDKGKIIKHTTLIELDENDIPVSFKRYMDDTDSLQFSLQASTDEDGNYLFWEFYNAEGEATGYYSFIYDNEKKSGFRYINAEGDTTMTQKFEFDDKGSVIKQTIISKDGSEEETEYTYEYDNFGNWIKVYAKSSNVNIISEREIVYYEN
jgi:hypothetical protein